MVLEKRRYEDTVFLKHFWCVLATYADDHGGRFPDELTAVFSGQDPYSPLTGMTGKFKLGTAPVSLTDVRSGNIVYQYVGSGVYLPSVGRNVMPHSEVPLMHTKAGFLGNFVTVLYADGRSELVRDDRLSLKLLGH